MSEVLLEKKTKALKKQIEILINSVEDYMGRAKGHLQTAKVFMRVRAEKLDWDKLNEIESAFNDLKDIFVFGDIEEKIPTLIESLQKTLEKENK